MESRLSGSVRVVGLIAAAVAGGCAIEEHPPAASTASAPVPDTTAVLAALDAYYRDFSARDWDAFASHFWPGADITTVWQPPGDTAQRVVVTPIPQFVAQAPDGPGSKEVFEESMVDAHITVEGDLAHARVSYHARFGDPGDIAEWDGVDFVILMRFGGVWKIVELAFAPGGGPGG